MPRIIEDDWKYQLYNEDCFETFKRIPDGSIDLVLTDIPYGEVNRKSNGLRKLDKGVADTVTFDLDKVVSEVVRCCSGSAYIFCGIEQVSQIRAGFVASGLSTRLCIWEKSNPSPMNGQHIWLSSIECCVFGKRKNAVFKEHCKSSVWKFPTARGKLHPTMKPIKLMEYLVSTSSNEGNTVLDFALGSGTTGVACGNLNRKFIGCDSDKEHGYFQIAQQRIKAAYQK